MDTSFVQAIRHACVRVESKNPACVLYFDPYDLSEAPQDADVILVTHPHYDHFSPQDIARVASSRTVLVGVEACREQAAKIGYANERFVSVTPGQKLEVKGISIEVVPAYNMDKQFHPQAEGWVGYVLSVNGARVYVMGDTDANEDVLGVQADVVCVPVGGKYTMDAAEAAAYVNAVKPALAIPIHYATFSSIAPTADGFREAVDADIDVIIPWTA